MSDRLAPELLDAVFQKLRDLTLDDPLYITRVSNDLSECSVVCKAWSSPARGHLFRSITYSFRRPPQNGPAGWANLRHGPEGRWGQYLKEPERVPYKTLEMLVSFLCAAPGIARCIQQLSLVGFPSDWRFSRTAGKLVAMFGSQDRFDPELLMSLLQLLPQLWSLKIRHVVPARPLAQRRSIKHEALKRLTVDFNSRHPRTRDPEMLLRCFGQLEELTLHGVAYDTGTGWAPLKEQDASTLALESLLLREFTFFAPELLELLMKSPTVQTLRSLRLEYIGASALPSVQAFINAAGPSVKTLRYEMMTSSIFAVQNQTIDLTACRSLEQLVITFDLEVDDPEQVQTACDAVTSVFDTISAPTQVVYKELKEVTLEILLGSVDIDHTATQAQMECKHQVALEQALHTLVERSSVAQITVQCEFDPDWNAERTALQMVKTMFPNLHRRRRLNIEV